MLRRMANQGRRAKTILRSLIVVLLFLPFIVHADELPELKAQMKVMQRQMQEMQKKIEKLEAQRPARIETPKEMEERVIAGDLTISGYAQVLYRRYELDSENDSFSLPRVRLKFDGHVSPDFAYRIQIDAAASSNILRDVYIKYTKYPFANVVAGQAFIPFSEEQLYPTTDLELIDRSLVTSRLSYDRDIGVQLLGELFDKKVSYGAGVFNGAGRNTADNNDNKDIVARAVISPFKGKDVFLEGLSLGAAFQYGKQPRSGNTEGDRAIIGTMAKYEYDKLKIQGEYLFRKQEQILGLSDKDAEGWYILAAYYFLPKLQAAVRYEQYDPDRDISQDREDMLTLGLNYFVNDNLKLQANYRFRDEQAEVGNNEFVLQLQVKY